MKYRDPHRPYMFVSDEDRVGQYPKNKLTLSTHVLETISAEDVGISFAEILRSNPALGLPPYEEFSVTISVMDFYERFMFGVHEDYNDYPFWTFAVKNLVFHFFAIDCSMYIQRELHDGTFLSMGTPGETLDSLGQLIYNTLIILIVAGVIEIPKENNEDVSRKLLI